MSRFLLLLVSLTLVAHIGHAEEPPPIGRETPERWPIPFDKDAKRVYHEGGQKHAYITASAEPWIKKVNCVVGQAWGPDHWWIVNNSPDPATVRYGGNARVAGEHAQLGAWHHIEYYLRLNSAPMVRDGIALLKVDGKLYIDLRDVPFIHTVPQTWNRMALPSMFGGGTPPLESFGWQLDDLEIWNGLPEPGKRAESRPQ